MTYQLTGDCTLLKMMMQWMKLNSTIMADHPNQNRNRLRFLYKHKQNGNKNMNKNKLSKEGGGGRGVEKLTWLYTNVSSNTILKLYEILQQIKNILICLVMLDYLRKPRSSQKMRWRKKSFPRQTISSRNQH